ncbi:hypothetical protein ABHN03_25320 [Paenibacillus sp. NRS-1775]|uniref:hypothetical protein n=1 Tax=unclassified Paenibacillus TaxID=185978 RepID=UPI003D27455D
MKKLTCQEPECVELNKSEDEDIELVLYVEETETTQYKINNDGTLRVWDSDCGGQTAWLICPCCDNKYEFDRDYFAIEKCAKLGFDIKNEENFKINRTKRDWEN